MWGFWKEWTVARAGIVSFHEARFSTAFFYASLIAPLIHERVSRILGSKFLHQENLRLDTEHRRKKTSPVRMQAEATIRKAAQSLGQ
jgi:hypothetical protein